MRRAVVVLLLMICVSSVAFGKKPEARQLVPDEIGRYQLVSGKYTVVEIKKNNPIEKEVSGLFVIDTKTGQVYEYYEIQLLREEKAKIMGEWRKLPTWISDDIKQYDMKTR